MVAEKRERNIFIIINLLHFNVSENHLMRRKKEKHVWIDNTIVILPKDT